MKRTAIGVGLATLALYAWGMVYWGFNPLPYTAWKQTSDDAAVGRAIRTHFPETGTYYLPGLHHDLETQERLYAEGPVAMIHVTSRDGRPRADTAIFAKGLLLNFAVCAVVAWLLHQAAPALRSYGSRVAFSATAGLACAILVDLGDVVWWYIPLGWKIHQAFYTFSAWVVSGLVLARFAAPGARQAGRVDQAPGATAP